MHSLSESHHSSVPDRNVGIFGSCIDVSGVRYCRHRGARAMFVLNYTVI